MYTIPNKMFINNLHIQRLHRMLTPNLNAYQEKPSKFIGHCDLSVVTAIVEWICSGPIWKGHTVCDPLHYI